MKMIRLHLSEICDCTCSEVYKITFEWNMWLHVLKIIRLHLSEICDCTCSKDHKITFECNMWLYMNWFLVKFICWIMSCDFDECWEMMRIYRGRHWREFRKLLDRDFDARYLMKELRPERVLLVIRIYHKWNHVIAKWRHHFLAAWLCWNNHEQRGRL